MNKSMKTSALLVAGVFALSGCGSSSEAADSGSAESSPSPSPTLAVGQDQYTADELEAAVTAVKAAQGLTDEVQNDATLQSQLSSVSGFTATPEQCVWLMSSLFDKTLADGTLAGLTLDGSEVLLLASYEDSTLLDQQAEASGQLSKDCAEFQLERDGVPLPASMEAVEASTEAPTTQAFHTTITRPNGKGEAIQVRALSGTTSISVTALDPTDVPAAVTKAEDAINAVLVELEKK